jgi:hypothetical protein
MKHSSFSECLENQMRMFYLSNEPVYDLDQNLPIENPSLYKRSFKNLKRNEEKQELMSFIRNALLRNYKLKSQIKTTRF